jgi:signal transduction histidine kinase
MLEPPLCNALVLADRALLRRVIENILDNSLRFTPEFGRMSLTACADEAVEISVSNTGPAIPLSERQRVFEKFARLDRMRSGNAGLGLYFCKRVLDALGGSIEITETPEWPTSFVLRLPTSS